MTEYEKLEVEVNLMGELSKLFSQMIDDRDDKTDGAGVTLEDMANWFKDQAESKIKHFADGERDKLLVELSRSLTKD